MTQQLKVELIQKRERRGSKPRLYVTIPTDARDGLGSNEPIEKFESAIRQNAKQMRKWIPEILHRVESMLAVKPGTLLDAEVRWSAKAGCGCGCSPGFVVDGYAGGNDVFATVEEV